MAENFQAKIDVILGGLRELAALEDRLKAIDSIVTSLKKKPIDLNIGGRGASRDLSGKLSKSVNDLVRNFNNFGKSFSSVSKQAALFGDLLSQTSLKSTGEFKKQDVAVKNLAVAYTTAQAKAAKFEQQQLNLIRTSKGLQTSTEREIQLIKRRAKVSELRGRKQRGERLREDIALGAGFPLLFGGGPGAVLGGLGGALASGGKGGFGLQILFSALGDQLDNFVRNLSQTAESVGTNSDLLSVLDTAGVKVAGSLQLVIKELEETGQQTRAFALAQTELQKAYGGNALTDLSNYDRANQRLADSFKRITSVVMPPLLRIATAISDITAGATNIFADAVNQVVEAFRFLAGTPPGGGTGRARPDFRLEGSFAEASAFDRKVAQEAATRLPGEEQRDQFKSSAFFKRYEKQTQQLKEQRSIVREINQIERQRTQEKDAALKKEIDLQRQQLQIVVDRAAQDLKNIQERNRLLRMGFELEKQILTYKEDANKADMSARQKILDVNAMLLEAGKKGFISDQDSEKLQKNIDAAVIFQKVSDLSGILGRATETYSVDDILILTNYYKIALTQEQNLQKELEERKKLLNDIEKARETAATIDRFVQPLIKLSQEHERSLETQREYNRLLMEGMLPAEAKRISEFNEQVKIQLQQIDNAILLAEAEAVRLSTNKLLTEEYQEQLKKIEDLKKARGAVTAEGGKGPGGKEKNSQDIIKDRIAELRGELTEMTNLGNIAVNVADGIGSAFSTAFQEVVNGSKSTQEALSDMFRSVAADFLKMAADIIAKQLVMIALQTLLKALGAVAGGGGGNSSTPDPFSSNVASALPDTGNLADVAASTPLKLNAEGSYVSGPTATLVGEGGQGEYIIPESKMRESMARYSRGARGGSVIPEAGGSGTSGEGGGTAVAAPIDVRYTVERINSVDYVTADQFQAGMRQAATQGAKQGEQQTLKRLQMSSSTRKRIGM